jgi:hypothetical protein
MIWEDALKDLRTNPNYVDSKHVEYYIAVYNKIDDEMVNNDFGPYA